MLQSIKTTVEKLDDVKDNYNFKYFTVRNGKAKYHLLHVPDGTVGLYYALRMTDKGLTGRRALEPNTKITCWVAT